MIVANLISLAFGQGSNDTLNKKTSNLITRQEPQSTSPSSNPPSQTERRPQPAPSPPPVTTLTPQQQQARHFKQFTLFLAGAGFMAASVAVARRSVLRKRLESFPKFYVSNRAHPKTIDSADRGLLAVQALGLATLNVMSFGVMLVGGLSWAFDLSSVADLRQRTRAALERHSGDVDSEQERELEAMMDGLLAKLGMEKPEETEGPGAAEGEDPVTKKQQ